MTAPERSLNHEEECRRLTRRLEREKLARLEAEKYSEELLRHAYERQRDLELLNLISEAANASGSMDSMMQEIVQQVCTHFGWGVGHVYLRQADRMASSRIWFLSDPEKYRAFVKDTEVQTFASDVGLPGRVIAAAASVEIEDVREDSNFPRRLSARDSHLVGGLGVPVMVGREVLAVLEFFDESRLSLTESQHQVLQQIAGQLARSAERHRAQADVDRQVERLAALRAIDIAISSSMDLNLTLAVFLEQVLNQLDADAANVFLYNAHTHSLTCATSKGFAHLGSCREVRLGSALPGRSALQQRIIYIADIARRPDLFDHFPGVLNDGYVSCIAAPLMAKGNVKGVLEVYKRGHQTPSPDYIDFVEALAGQAAIAVDNATLFHGLQRSNLEISVAYDATIEGWAKALDMRDNETGGHTQRVTEITLGLARILRIPDEDMVHLRRGALLHDIGKMGVPDKILHKPGKLDEEEWIIMKKHTTFARDLLLGIDFLRKAAEIPYSHHERWNGSGYPLGLREEQIPFSARIFAVADVWDALTHVRPYKRAWSPEEAMDFLRNESGILFDPRVVEAMEQYMISRGELREAYYLRDAA